MIELEAPNKERVGRRDTTVRRLVCDLSRLSCGAGRHLPKFSSITEVLGSTPSMAQINQLEMKRNDPHLSTRSL